MVENLICWPEAFAREDDALEETLKFSDKEIEISPAIYE